ncbi:hypothetical protein [Chondromyces crocatus]|uniref:Lipid/polyisoprenoid-binding YceI-like domain-containing protein n=1 Tax=Chondromyces crocatus TaxID=52 RepID=A0A0K1EMN2_CHOCO|nr:hypothetical protein [Chondromyces crocatus]AKT41902.1 uncharacterized protein CMC5_061240 [Chondromyces crocatus]
MAELNLDPAASRLTLRTRAAGMLARLAHDLELEAKHLRGHARVEGDTWTAELQIPVESLSVAGTLRGERLDPSALSASDRGEIERRVRDEVLRGTQEVKIQASGRTRTRAEVRIVLQGAETRLSAALDTREGPGGALTVSGSCRLSLRDLKIAEIKGPLGAFKIRDDVEVRFDITLRPTST